MNGYKKRRFIWLGIFLLLAVLTLFFYAGRVPSDPRQYLTLRRNKELTSFSDSVLGIDGLITLSINYDKTIFQWKEKLNGKVSEGLSDRIVPVLKRNKLQAMRVDARKKKVVFGQLFLRQWYEYIYVKSDELDPNQRYQSTLHLTNNWYFGTR